MKKIICTNFGKIVYATINEKTHSIGNDSKNVTEDCVKAVTEHMLFKARETGFYKYEYKSADGTVYCRLSFELFDDNTQQTKLEE